jgi:hypothetical protein
MASIDQYNCKLLGFINCPSAYDFVYDNATRDIGVYELLEDIPSSENNFDGKAGGVIVGGGNGEAPALRIKMPDCLDFFILDNTMDLKIMTNYSKHFGLRLNRLNCVKDLKNLVGTLTHLLNFG